ncbi:acyl-CoA dehydrogenase family protein [Haloarcula japonica]|uniref:acyl-CoA dehydrogenase family protein n=1 Tax=Haloarcula japonica TaxID=29282 RepID=UPI00373FCD19
MYLPGICENVNTTLQTHGANGITTDYLVEKLVRDAPVMPLEDRAVAVLGQALSRCSIFSTPSLQSLGS